ncbi:MAG: FdhD protein [Paracoccaceae bacterium]
MRAAQSLPITRLGDSSGPALRMAPEESPVAFSYNGTVHAVMMATPRDLEDFAVGFSITEGIVTGEGGIESLEIIAHPAGLEARMWLPDASALALTARRRSMAGPVGCGLCGIESLEEAIRPLPVLPAGALRIGAAQALAALDGLRASQPLHDETRAVHAAGFWTAAGGMALAREDVGRHNALDKLIGALARAGTAAGAGAVILSSRVSVEMVQKCAMAGAPVILAMSSPTAHAVRLADGAGMTVACRARGAAGRLDVFCGADRLTADDGAEPDDR